MDLRNGFVCLQEFCHGFGVVTMFLHADREGLDPPQREPTVEGARNGAERVLGELELLVEVLPVHHEGAPEQIRMPADVFRRAVDDEIDRSEEHTSELQSQSNLVCRL